jgi:hypothetical protein
LLHQEGVQNFHVVVVVAARLLFLFALQERNDNNGIGAILGNFGSASGIIPLTFLSLLIRVRASAD